jgi:hypothetical protein
MKTGLAAVCALAVAAGSAGSAGAMNILPPNGSVCGTSMEGNVLSTGCLGYGGAPVPIKKPTILAPATK